MQHWQRTVGQWVEKTFGFESRTSRRERSLRFMEEALELGQSLGIKEEEAILLVTKVFERPPGQPNQERGGVMVTLLALTDCERADLWQDFLTEWDRINSAEAQERMQRRQKEKQEQGL